MKKIITALCIMMSVNMVTYANNTVYDENNNLISYSSTYNGTDKFVLPAISKKIAHTIAINFLKTHAPEVLNEINTENHTITYNKSYPYGYNIVFPRVIYGIEYTDNSLNLFIDSSTGEVVNYTKNFTNGITVEDTSSLIDIESAKEKYKSAMGIHLQYNKKITDNNIHTYLTYTADDIMINAVTGNVISTPYYIPSGGYFDTTHTAEKVSEYVDDKSVMSISQADKIINNIPELEINDNYNITSVNYLKTQDGTYLISLAYQYSVNLKEITLNAKTGTLVEYIDNSTDTSAGNFSDTYAEKFAEKHYSSYINSSIKRKSITDTETILLYERSVNGIPYKSNGLYIYSVKGKLKHISLAWDNVEFESTEEIITIEQAYENLFNKCGLEQDYYKRENNILTPVYQLSPNGTGIIDAKTGKQLNYDGSIYYSAKEMNYIDINSHYSGDIANKMSDCDIYVSSGHVFLSDHISQQEYLLLISEFIDGTKPVLNTTGMLTDDQLEMLYAYMYANNVMDRSETDYKGYVTRTDAVKYFLRILGYGTVGDMSDIFIKHFNDTDDIPQELIGYVELARSMGIISGSTDNNFKPKEFLTNGDSLIIMYNYLKQQG